jgi:prevent-host-death family protein
MATSVGIREAKIHLSHLLKKVRRGMEIVITERGKPVGKIVPLRRSSLSLAERISELEMRGIIEEKKSPSKSLPPPLPMKGDVAQRLLQQDRDGGK